VLQAVVRFDRQMQGIGAGVGAWMHQAHADGDNVVQRLEESERRVREAMARARSRRFGGTGREDAAQQEAEAAEGHA
jgi:hypothetical protein